MTATEPTRDQGAGGGLVEVLAEHQFAGRIHSGEGWVECLCGAHVPWTPTGEDDEGSWTAAMIRHQAEALAPTVARLIEVAETRAVARYIRSKHAADCETFTNKLGKCNCHRDAVAERDELRERLAGVEALADEWDNEGVELINHAHSGRDVNEGGTWIKAASDLRAVLHPEESRRGPSDAVSADLRASGGIPRVSGRSEGDEAASEEGL
jgi:hypothetical protein